MHLNTIQSSKDILILVISHPCSQDIHWQVYPIQMTTYVLPPNGYHTELMTTFMWYEYIFYGLNYVWGFVQALPRNCVLQINSYRSVDWWISLDHITWLHVAQIKTFGWLVTTSLFSLMNNTYPGWSRFWSTSFNDLEPKWVNYCMSSVSRETYYVTTKRCHIKLKGHKSSNIWYSFRHLQHPHTWPTVSFFPTKTYHGYWCYLTNIMSPLCDIPSWICRVCDKLRQENCSFTGGIFDAIINEISSTRTCCI